VTVEDAAPLSAGSSAAKPSCIARLFVATCSEKRGGAAIIGKLLLIGLLLAVAAPAAAQPGPAPPSPYAAQPDKPSCTRAELKAATAAYVAAQKSGDVSGLPLDPKARFLENMQTVERGKGLWNTPLPVADALSFHDSTRCKTFTQIIVTEGGKPYVIGTRLYLHAGKIIRVDSLVTHPGDWLFNANAYLRYSKAEDWSDLKKGQGTAPAEMIRGANAYLDSFSDKFTDAPWGIPCARLEGGAYTTAPAIRKPRATSASPRGCSTSSTGTIWSTTRRA
jgi:hypothetical protein